MAEWLLMLHMSVVLRHELKLYKKWLPDTVSRKEDDYVLSDVYKTADYLLVSLLFVKNCSVKDLNCQ
jgi:hypothetical protein